jgi:uncharacterized protein YdhG (YjbR/CyaY superfamily)
MRRPVAAARRPYVCNTIDEYLAGVKSDQRRLLQKFCQTIRAVAPQATECTSYGIPAFRLNGRSLVLRRVGKSLLALSRRLGDVEKISN